MSRIVFFQVSNSQTKVKRIVDTCQFHFENREKILIIGEEASLPFIDELLWKYPATSFLPHQVIHNQGDALVSITCQRQNLTHARFAFNLTPTPLFLSSPIQIIYEFEDLSTPIKKNLSEKRYDAYRKSGFLIEAR